MSETATVQVNEVKVGKTGTSAKGPWTRYDLIDGNGERFSTFSRGLAEEAKPFIGKLAQLEYEANEKGKNFTAIREASGNGDTPALGTGEYVTGQKPPIEARRIFASTAWNNATRLTELYWRLRPTSQETTTTLVWETAAAFASQIFDDLIRRGDAYIEEKDARF